MTVADLIAVLKTAPFDWDVVIPDPLEPDCLLGLKISRYPGECAISIEPCDWEDDVNAAGGKAACDRLREQAMDEAATWLLDTADEKSEFMDSDRAEVGREYPELVERYPTLFCGAKG